MRSSQPHSSSSETPLAPLLKTDHPLVKLASAIDWDYFEREFSSATTEAGGPALASRLMVGLHYLKAMYDESDESVVEKWTENPDWQYLCGEQFFQHKLPCHPSSLVKWRKRVGTNGVEKLLKQVLRTARQYQAFSKNELKCVTVDTTVQPKAVAFPTDAKLDDKARRALVRAAKSHAIKLRQTYVRLGKQALFKQSRYAAVRQGQRAHKQTKIRTFLGRVIRDIERQLTPIPQALQTLLERAKQIHRQQKQDTNKGYSIHAPEVECIAQAKAHRRYEFGCKVAVVTTTASNWIVGIEAHHGNPYDGTTLKPAVAQVQRLSGVQPQKVLVDQGFRGQDHHPNDVQVLICDKRKRTGSLKRLLRRRSAIEPVIGHSKSDHALGHNYLQAQRGNQINALLVGCGFNLRKLCHFLSSTPPNTAQSTA
ncbi:IS5 family transposase [Gloeocapsopsis dulcis]|uniref:IS5/IS1182 family transposase n=1 Tax=Gloeocapsopsis dulcis AAB1 = 1H9 TaxID=1433147 RepID=A0A6N8FZ04_9CHRO|nr:IS5 family transposase [Gloeocapsopsis dulcis]MUL38380.1 IS5/IS1182 family transposase [Gloeocapsopsis dulcis AAB1 = 1H9]WNN91577.1 IS5 family transposase [Gloeocapsopsis dulcis]